MTVKDIQTRLIGLGFPLKKFGADGDFGEETQTAINAALDALEAARGASKPPKLESQPVSPAVATSSGLKLIPDAWMPLASMKRIIVHWTAGANIASSLDKEHYHFLIEGDGDLVRGLHSIKDNESVKGKTTDQYAAHTLNCNTGSIGISLCGMAGAVESPFNPGKSPINAVQWKRLAEALAQLCKKYNINPTRQTVLSHAEVQGTLEIPQRGKWDISRLPFDSSVKGALPVGDKMRQGVLELM